MSYKNKAFWWVFIGTFICLPIVLFYFHTPNDWLGFWGGYLGAAIAIGGVFWQVMDQRQQEKESVRPKFSVTQLRVLDVGLKVNVGNNNHQWLTPNSGSTDDNILLRVGLDETGEEIEPLTFNNKIRYNPTLIGIDNITKNDAYTCLVELKYYSGPETDKVLKRGITINDVLLEHIRGELHTETFLISGIDGKERSIFVPAPALYSRRYLLFSVKMTYETEKAEINGWALQVESKGLLHENKIPVYDYSISKSSFDSKCDTYFQPGFATVKSQAGSIKQNEPLDYKKHKNYTTN